MGINVNRGPSIRVIRPKAIVGRTLDNDLIAKTTKLFQTYKEIPLINFSTLYSDAYGEIFDASALAFDNGLLGFFEHMQIIEIERTQNGYICRLPNQTSTRRQINGEHSEPRQIKQVARLNPSENDDPSSNWLFDPEDTYLWPERRGIKNLLYKKPIILASSPLEMALERDKHRVRYEISKINQMMSRFPDGIRLNEIGTQININKRLLNTTSIDSMVHEYPELFFVVEPKKEGEDKIVYSGVTRTEADLSGSLLRKSSTGIIYTRTIVCFILTGLYQKTLLLIRAASSKGLKLASWHSSIKINFKVIKAEANMLENDPVILFRVLAFSGLVEIFSPDNCKNDLRVRLPTKRIDFEEFMNGIYKRLKAAELQVKTDRWKSISSYGSLKGNVSPSDSLSLDSKNNRD